MNDQRSLFDQLADVSEHAIKSGMYDAADFIARHREQLSHYAKELAARDVTVAELRRRLAVLEPFAEVMDDEFMRVVAGYEYNVRRLHRAWLAVRAAADAGKGK